MFKVTPEVYDPDSGCIDPTIRVAYDGYEFSICKRDDDLYRTCPYQVMSQRQGRWDYYGITPYDSVAEACEAIFGTILVNRTECAYPVFDWRGEVVGWKPLSYYDLDA